MFQKIIHSILLICVLTSTALAEPTSKSVAKESDEGIVKVFSGDMTEEKRNEAHKFLDSRLEICKRTPADCLKVDKLLKTVCGSFDEKNDAILQKFWDPVLAAVTTEKQALKLWTSTMACANSPTTGQLRGMTNLLKKASTSKWKKLQSGISAWAGETLKNPPKGSIPYSLILLSGSVSNLGESRPIDFALMDRFSTLATSWVLKDPMILKDRTDLYEPIAIFMHALADIGKMEIVRQLFVSLKLQDAKMKPEVAAQIGYSSCAAFRQLGSPRDCIGISDQMIKPSSKEQAVFEKAEADITQGLYKESYDKVQGLKTNGVAKPQYEPLANIFTGVNALYLGKIDEARTHTDKFVEQVKEADIPASKIFGPLYQSKILMSEGKYDEAWKKLEAGRGDMEAGTRGAFRAKLFYEFQTLLVAGALGDSAKKTQSVKRVKSALVGDPSEKFIKEATDLIAKKSKDKKAYAAEFEALVSKKGVSDPELQDLKKVQPALSK